MLRYIHYNVQKYIIIHTRPVIITPMIATMRTIET